MERGLAFVGGYMNGELGPLVKRGYMGWTGTPAAVHSVHTLMPHLGGAAPAPPANEMAVADGEGEEGGEAVECGSSLQGFTSMYAVLG